VEEEADEEVGVAVMLTLNVVVTAVANEETWLFVEIAVVSVVVAVVSDKETLGDAVEDALLEEELLLDWAAATAARPSNSVALSKLRKLSGRILKCQ